MTGRLTLEARGLEKLELNETFAATEHLNSASRNLWDMRRLFV